MPFNGFICKRIIGGKVVNKCFFVGRTTRDVEIRYTQENKAVGRFSFAVDIGYGDNKKTHFFNMTAFGKTAEVLEKYAKKGTKLILECSANQNQYTDKSGNRVNDVGFIVLAWEFGESKNSSGGNQNNSNGGFNPPPMPSDSDGFMNIPDGIDNELPFV